MVTVSLNPQRTVRGVFHDFNARRNGLVKALTTEVDKFYEQCDPETVNLCLYGLPNEKWEVNIPEEEIPPDLPEPTLGINFSRDGMLKKDWLSLVAAHSDSWLHAVAFFYAASFGFTKIERMTLFQMINELPPLPEVLEGNANHDSNINREFSGMSLRPGNHSKAVEMPIPPVDQNTCGTICGACGGDYDYSEFWIYCDFCKLWLHGLCEKMTPAKAEQIEQYKCRRCTKRPPRG